MKRNSRGMPNKGPQHSFDVDVDNNSSIRRTSTTEGSLLKETSDVFRRHSSSEFDVLAEPIARPVADESAQLLISNTLSFEEEKSEIPLSYDPNFSISASPLENSLLRSYYKQTSTSSDNTAENETGTENDESEEQFSVEENTAGLLQFGSPDPVSSFDLNTTSPVSYSTQQPHEHKQNLHSNFDTKELANSSLLLFVSEELVFEPLKLTPNSAAEHKTLKKDTSFLGLTVFHKISNWFTPPEADSHPLSETKDNKESKLDSPTPSPNSRLQSSPESNKDNAEQDSDYDLYINLTSPKDRPQKGEKGEVADLGLERRSVACSKSYNGELRKLAQEVIFSNRRHVGFLDQTEVKLIPNRQSLSKSVRKQLWFSKGEFFNLVLANMRQLETEMKAKRKLRRAKSAEYTNAQT